MPAAQIESARLHRTPPVESSRHSFEDATCSEQMRIIVREQAVLMGGVRPQLTEWSARWQASGPDSHPKERQTYVFGALFCCARIAWLGLLCSPATQVRIAA